MTAGATARGQDAAGRAAADVSLASDETAISSTLTAYDAALNGGRTEAVLPLYTPDGILMTPCAPSAIGQAVVRKAYDAVFAELKFNVTFTVAEVVPIAPTWAYVRTNSASTQTFRRAS